MGSSHPLGRLTLTSFELLLAYILLTIAGSLALLLIIAGIHKFCTDEDFRAGTLVIGMVIAWIGGMLAVTTALYLNYPLDPYRIGTWFLGHWEIIWLAAVVSLAGGFALRSRSNRAFIWALTKVTVTYLGAVALLTLTYFSVTQLLIKYGVLN